MAAEPDAAEDAETESDADALARDLGDAIADLPEHSEFEAARRAVQADEELQARIREFEQRREEFVLARQAGDVTQEDAREIQQAQEDLHDHPTMAEFLEAKAALQDRLEELNRAVSAPLAVDFGGEAGGCCQD